MNQKSSTFEVLDFFMENKIFQKFINSPIGWIEIKTSANSLLNISFAEKAAINSPTQPVILQQTELQLKEYFEGKRKIFDLKLNPTGTEFQKGVWKLVKNINFGKTASYLEIAVQTGSSKNTRAVGMANGRNPIPIIIPCHRIIGLNGKLTGYAGGLERKRWLLLHELEYSEKSKLLF